MKRMKKIFNFNLILSLILLGIISCNSQIEDNIEPPDLTPPAEVTNLSVKEENASVLLSWVNPSDSDFYKIEITYTPQVQNISQPIILEEKVNTSCEYRFTNLINNTEYTFTIITIDTNNNKSKGSSIKAFPRETSFTVKYESEYGALSDSFKTSIQIKENTILKSENLPSLSAEGYVFGGWWDGETQVIPEVYKVTKNVTLKAKWTVATVSYTVSFVSAHGTKPENIILPENTVLMENNAPTLSEEGYKFDGWYDGETKIEVGSYKIVKDVELTAKWIACWTIHFDSNGGTGTMPDQFMEGDGNPHPLNNNCFVREGYTFIGWNLNYNTDIPQYNNEALLHLRQIDEPNKGPTLYAMWTPITYTVRFDTNHGSYEDIEYNFGSQHSYAYEKYDISNNGIHIVSWNTKSDGSGISYPVHSESDWRIINFDDLVTENGVLITLYAQWDINTYTIILKGSSGLTEDGEDTVYINCLFGESYNLSNPFKRKGYYLCRWDVSKKDSTSSYNGPNCFSENEVVQNLTTVHCGVITFLSQWADERYYINFNANGGSGTIKYLYVRPNEIVTLPSNKFTHSNGYPFLYWEGGYLEGESVCNLAKPGTSITLKAIWGEPGEIIYVPVSKAERVLNKLQNNSRYKLSFYGEIDENKLSHIVDIIVSKNLSVDLHLEDCTGLSKISNLSNCLWLKSLYLANETKIGVMALYGCNNLEGIYYPNYREMNDKYYLGVGGNVPSNGTRWISLTSEQQKKASLVSEKIYLTNYSLTSTANWLFASLVTNYGDDLSIKEFKGYEYEWQPIRK